MNPNDELYVLFYSFAGLYGSIVVYRPGTLSNDDIVSSVFGKILYFLVKSVL